MSQLLRTNIVYNPAISSFNAQVVANAIGVNGSVYFLFLSQSKEVGEEGDC